MEEKNESCSSSFSSKGAEPQRADAATLHAVYSALLGRLTLVSTHREALRKRGLKDDGIDSRGYRTYPFWGKEKLAAALFDQFGEVIRKVPGFVFEKEGQAGLTLAGGDGMLIPVLDAQAHIVGLRIRPDDPGEGPKYYWLSSAKHGGPGPGAPVHVPKMIAMSSRTGRVTEGELKADVAVSLGSLPTVSIAGVNTWQELPAVLRTLGWETVRMAFDMDAIKKKGVAKALDECSAALIGYGFALELELWPEAHKGIDDALLARADLTVLQGQDAKDAIARIFYQAHDNQGTAQIEMGDAHEAESPKENEEGDEEENCVYSPGWVPFPFQAFPDVLSAFCIEQGRALSANPAMLALYILGICASCIGRSRVIQIRPGSWYEPSAIFGTVIATSCSGKGITLRKAMEPVEKIDEKLFLDTQEAFARYDAQMEFYKTWKPEKGAEGPTLPIEPADRQLILMDATMEAIISRFKGNDSILFMFEEQRQWLLQMGAYAQNSASKGKEECIWMQIFDGVTYHYLRQKDRQRLRIKVLGSVIGATQPEIWDSLAGDMLFASGFIGRLLPIMPDRLPRTAYVEPSIAVANRYGDVVQSLAMLEAENRTLRHFQSIPMVLTPAAMREWNSWEAAWNDKIEQTDGNMQTMLSRMRTYCARFALVLSCVDLAAAGGAMLGPDIVEAEHIKNAVTLAQWFADEAERVYRRGSLKDVDKQRELVIGKIRMRCFERIPRKEWYSMTGRELWATNRPFWKDSKRAAAYLLSLTVDGDGGPGPLVELKSSYGKRYFLREKLAMEARNGG